jgi:hypothetical protein
VSRSGGEEIPMDIERKIANRHLRTWEGSRRKGRGHTDGRAHVCGKGGRRLYRDAKRGACAKGERLRRADEA